MSYFSKIIKAKEQYELMRDLEAELLLNFIVRQGKEQKLRGAIDAALDKGDKSEFLKCCEELRRVSD